MNSTLIVYLVSLAAFLAPFTQTIYVPILPELQGHFGTSQLLINLTISIFTLILAAAQVVYGPLTDSRGRRTVLLPGILLYVVASVGCAFAPNVWALLLFRALQAAGIAVGSVVATTVIGDLFTGARRSRAMGTSQMMVALGSVVGPVVGGVLGDRTGHTGIFLFLGAFALVILAAEARYVPETRPSGAATRGVLRLRDFWRIVSTPFGSAIIPLGFVQYYAYYCFLVFLPDILQRGHALTLQQTGLAFLPLSVAIVVGSFVGGRLQERWAEHRVLVVTTLLNALSVLAFVVLSRGSLAALIASCSAFGLFLGLSLPVQTSLLAGAFVHDRATAIGVYNSARYLGMAAGPLAGSLLYRWGHVPLLFGFTAAVFGGAVWLCRRRLAVAVA